ncbi:MAG: hypothetical protein IKJ48_07700 [Alistipes sp.]|nr:hypothetical protein [Alistipes sp.]
MADVNYDNIPSIIGIYEGTVAEFEAITNKSNFYGRLILITGDQTATDENAADRKQALWTSEEDGSNAHYLNMSDVATLKAQLAHIDGIAFPKDGGSSTSYDKYDLTGGKGFIFKGSNGITVKINPSTSTSIDGKPYWSIEVNGQTLKADLIGTTSNGSDTANHPDTIRGAKAYADSLYAELKGTKADGDTTDETIRGAKDYADAKISDAKTELKGTKADGDTTDETIRGAKDYADKAVAKIVSDGSDAATDDTIKGAKMYTDEAKESLLGKSGDASTENTIYGAKAYADTKDITIDSTNTDSTLAGKFVIKKDGVVLATINIPKELVVTKDGSEIVKGTWSGDTFTESETGPDKALKLAIQNQTTPIYINVADLVDVYTAAQGAAEVQLTISATNEISATIKAVSGAKITAKTITKDKLVDAVQTSLGKADSAYQLPETGIPKSDLAQEVQNSLDNAVMEMSAQPSDPDYLTINVSKSGTTRTISYDVKTDNTISDGINDTTKKGLATVEDVAAYLNARLAVKVVS